MEGGGPNGSRLRSRLRLPATSVDSYKRMTNEPAGTAASILTVARELFAQRGYDGTSVRAISARAGVNLGAITYHFGSKAGLYSAVIQSVVGPLRERVVAVAQGSEPPLDKLAEIVVAYFDHFAHTPDMPKLVVQQFFTGQPLTHELRSSMEAILGALVGTIRTGQADGQIRAGSPQLMALSLLAQPIYFNIIRGPLAQAGLLDFSDPTQYRAVVDHVTRFAIAGLTQQPGAPE